MPRVTKANLRRALVLLSNALPDTQGAMTGFLMALTRKTAPDWVDPRDYSSGIGASTVPTACLAPHAIQGGMTLPQSSTATSMLQSLIPVSEERAKTKTVVELACQTFEGDSLPETLPSALIWGQMLCGALCQALRYVGLAPSTLWQEGAWPFVNAEAERAFMGHLCRSDTLTVNALADTVATVMVRLYNIELPVSFVASLHWRNTTTRAPDQRAYEYGAAPWVQQHWTWTPEAVTPHNLPAEIVSTLSEPGLARCPNDLITKSIRPIGQPPRNRIVCYGQQRSEILQQGVSLVSGAGVGIGINVYRMRGLPDPGIGTPDEVQVSDIEVRPKGDSQSRGSDAPIQCL